MASRELFLLAASGWQEMRSISTLPVAAARATKSKDRDTRLQRRLPKVRADVAVSSHPL
jgi:hypothetical protein